MSTTQKLNGGSYQKKKILSIYFNHSSSKFYTEVHSKYNNFPDRRKIFCLFSFNFIIFLGKEVNILNLIYITISIFTYVFPYGVHPLHPSCHNFKFLIPAVISQMSVIKVTWYVFRVKNIHSWAPPDPWGPWDEEELSYIHYDIRREEAKQGILKLASMFHHLSSIGPKQLCASAQLECTRKADTS